MLGGPSRDRTADLLIKSQIFTVSHNFTKVHLSLDV